MMFWRGRKRRKQQRQQKRQDRWREWHQLALVQDNEWLRREIVLASQMDSRRKSHGVNHDAQSGSTRGTGI